MDSSGPILEYVANERNILTQDYVKNEYDSEVIDQTRWGNPLIWLAPGVFPPPAGMDLRRLHDFYEVVRAEQIDGKYSRVVLRGQIQRRVSFVTIELHSSTGELKRVTTESRGRTDLMEFISFDKKQVEPKDLDFQRPRDETWRHAPSDAERAPNQLRVFYHGAAEPEGAKRRE